MSDTSPPLDSAAKFWLSFLAAAVLAGVTIAVYNLIHENPLAPERVRPEPSIAIVDPNHQTANPFPSVAPTPVIPFPAPNFSKFSTPAEKEAQRKIMIEKQASYLKEVYSHHSNTPSLATPEEVEEMRKEGRMAW